MVTLLNRNVKLDFVRKYLKKLAQLWNKILWPDETKINLYHNDGKRRELRSKGTAHNPKPLHHLSEMVEEIFLHGLVWLAIKLVPWC